MKISGEALVSQCYRKAIELLKKNATPEGFLASGSFSHYRSLWARDACIACLAANLSADSALLKTSVATLKTLKKLQSPLGQIINVYFPERKYWDWGEAGCTDTSAWFIIAVGHYYFKVGRKKSFLKEFWWPVKEAFKWLRYQDVNNFGLIDSPPAGEWCDSTLARGGKVLYTNCLFYSAALTINAIARELGKPKIAKPSIIKNRINLLFWPTRQEIQLRLIPYMYYPRGADVKLPHPCILRAYKAAVKKRNYYLSHVTYGSFVDVCDVLGNSLAIHWEIAGREKTRRILKYFSAEKVSSPFPAKVLSHPLTKAIDRWGIIGKQRELYQRKRWRNPPFHFHNAGIWPAVGGSYILALVKGGKREEAAAELKNLARANRLGKSRQWEFNEWLHGQTGKPMGTSRQTWSAASYILAYKAVVEKRKI